MEKYIIAHDLGTSGNKATLYGLDGRLVKSRVYSYGLTVGENGEAEQDAEQWWRAVCETTRELLDGVDPGDIAAVSFSGQMMGCLCVDRDGRPLYNALIWADMRSTAQQQALSRNIDPASFYRVTGHRLSPSYSITKLMWLRDNRPEVYRSTYLMLNAKDYMVYRLCGRFVTEPSDASSTALMDLDTQSWSKELFRASGLDIEKMPEIVPSVTVAGGVTKEAAELTGLLEGTPVVCGGGDGCCGAVGTGAVREGIANCCLGTSSWISFASKTPVYDPEMTTFNFAHIVPGYTLPCGTMQTGGGALSWAVKTFYGAVPGYTAPHGDELYAGVRKEAEASPLGANGLLFLPYLMGERSPRWNDKAKGSFIGLGYGHGRGDMIRSVMEGVGFNLDLIFSSFRRNGADIRELILVGGGARNKIWQSILADIFGIKVLVPDVLEEATSMGAAITAGVGVGAFSDFSAAERFVRIKEENVPSADNYAKYNEIKPLFDEAYHSLEGLFEKL